MNATVPCLLGFSRALQLETGQVYLLQGVLLVHCLFLLLLAKVIRESSLSMVSGGSQKSRGLLWWGGGGGGGGGGHLSFTIALGGSYG